MSIKVKKIKKKKTIEAAITKPPTAMDYYYFLFALNYYGLLFQQKLVVLAVMNGIFFLCSFYFTCSPKIETASIRH